METDANAAIGAAIQKFRVAAGMSQGELASKLADLGEPFHQQTVAKVEKGARPLKLTEALAVAKVLNRKVDDLTLSPHAIDKAAEERRAIDTLLKSAVALEEAAKRYEADRIELASWIVEERKAPGAFVSGALAVLSADPVGIVEQAQEETLREYLAELPGVEVDREVLELLGWEPSDAPEA